MTESRFNTAIYHGGQQLDDFLSTYFSLPGWTQDNLRRLRHKILCKGIEIHGDRWRNQAQRLWLLKFTDSLGY